MLHPTLYRTLVKQFGRVKISNQGATRLVETGPEGRPMVTRSGEQYNVNCPVCGDDRGRLGFSYMFLKRLGYGKVGRQTRLARCFNEECQRTKPEQFGAMVDELTELYEGVELGLVDTTGVPLPTNTTQVGDGAVPLPDGQVKLSDLKPDHPAVVFWSGKYRIPLDRAIQAGAFITESQDPRFRSALGRIVFPISRNGRVVGWQGRLYVESRAPRWYSPAGFVKPVWNLDQQIPFSTIVVAEGITSALACGDNGVALFGKQASAAQIQDLLGFSDIVLATDPETYLPDSRGGTPVVYVDLLRDSLLRAAKRPIRVRKVVWSEDILAIAKSKLTNQDIDVPDPASLGAERMSIILKELT